MLKRYPNHWIRSRGEGKNARYNGFVGDNDSVLLNIVRGDATKGCKSFKRSGARKEIIWAENEVRAAIVVCGGLCPGLNNVITGLVETLYYNYGVDAIFGIDSGYGGFWNKTYRPWVRLTPKMIAGINQQGGSFIRSHRGGLRGHVPKIIDALILNGINQVYTVGGDGTHRGANIIQRELRKRYLKITVAGVPKTIDNDIGIIDQSFGFNSSVEKAKEAVLSALTEAKGAPNCIGIVKLMGRHSGYIAAHTTLVSHNVDLCMIPEVDFQLYGPNGILPYLQKVVKRKGYALIVLAEGAGSNMIKGDGGTDAGGNQNLPDIGVFLKNRLTEYFKDKFAEGENIKLKYHEPSYLIRSVPANTDDSILCMILASNAVHGAMAGYTGFTSGIVNHRSVMIPMEAITATSPSHLSKTGRTWQRVVSKSLQPRQD